uniref:Alternative protein USO1 n=1 Tax=Homo sapiens TaxID=9606 RepID=L8E922_HUMAN|nr:alternative protein USO1 [Homo sapiens]
MFHFLQDKLQKILEKKSSWSKAYVPFCWAFRFISMITHLRAT